MGSEFPGSPRVLKGGLVAYRLPDLFPTVIVFQYNPDEVSRSLQMQSASGGGGRGDANRVNGPPQETLTFSVEIDAADQLEQPGENAITVENGLHPVIASLERLVYPSYPLVIANEALALAGSAFILGETGAADACWSGVRGACCRCRCRASRSRKKPSTRSSIRSAPRPICRCEC